MHGSCARLHGAPRCSRPAAAAPARASARCGIEAAVVAGWLLCALGAAMAVNVPHAAAHGAVAA